MVHLVTGFAGQAHVASEDDGSKQAAIVGSGRYVANIGSKFEASIKSNNLVRIADGDLFNQGRHIRIPPNSYEEVTISNGSQGVNRNDLIVMRYEKSTSNGIETAALKVIKGTAGSTAKDPEYTQGDILAGDYVDEFPLYRVKITGLSIAAVEPMFDILLPMAEMYSRLNGKQIMLKTGTSGNIPSNVWNSIISFQLQAGTYLVMWQCKMDAIKNDGDIIFGSRLRFGVNDYPELRKYLSNQDNSISAFSWVEVADETTVYIEFYQNTGYEAYVSFRKAFIFPIS